MVAVGGPGAVGLGLRGLIAGSGVAACAVAATLWPAFTYVVSLALFGLPHVACELRYLDQRFGARIGDRLWPALVALLLAVALLRVAGLAQVGTQHGRAACELLLGAGLAAVLLPRLARRGVGVAAIGVAVLVAALFGAAFAPMAAVVVFALLHNATPVGLLAERLTGRRRAQALLACAVVFALAPLAIGSGVLGAGLAALGCHGSLEGPWGAGGVAEHLGAFVPTAWQTGAFGDDLFRAAAFAQCMHYAVVIGVLPRLGAGTSVVAAPRLRWPNARTFVVAVVVAAIVSMVGYRTAFRDTRALYGILAAVHAWVEVPALLLACAVPAARPRDAQAVAA